MAKAETLRPGALLLDVTALAVIWGFAAMATTLHALLEHSELVGSAVLIDSTVSAAVLHWLLGVRWGGLPKWTIAPVVGAGLLFARVILPAAVSWESGVPLLVVALAEGAVLLTVGARIRAVTRAFRAARQGGVDRFAALEAGILAALPAVPWVASWVRLELELWVLAFGGWWLRPTGAQQAPHFTHHKECGWSGIAGAITLLMVIEGSVLHLFLVSAGYTLAAWLAFAIHIYGLVWVLGDARALRVYRSTLSTQAAGSTLELRVGLRASTRIPLALIEAVTSGAWDAADADAAMASVTGFANVKLTLREAVELKRPLRKPVWVRVILVQVDEPARFERALAAARASIAD